jgi:leucyl-tRNA synthetase
MAEEAWRRIGQRGFAATAEWPEFEQLKEDVRSDELEQLMKQTLEDTQEIIATTKITPKRVHYYTAAKWKWRVYQEALTRADKQPETLNGLIRDMLAAKPPSAKDLPKFASRIINQVKTMPGELRTRKLATGELDERTAFAGAQSFFVKELRTEVEVHNEEDQNLYDPKKRAQVAEPYRPAIFIE